MGDIGTEVGFNIGSGIHYLVVKEIELSLQNYLKIR